MVARDRSQKAADKTPRTRGVPKTSRTTPPKHPDDDRQQRPAWQKVVAMVLAFGIVAGLVVAAAASGKDDNGSKVEAPKKAEATVVQVQRFDNQAGGGPAGMGRYALQIQIDDSIYPIYAGDVVDNGEQIINIGDTIPITYPKGEPGSATLDMTRFTKTPPVTTAPIAEPDPDPQPEPEEPLAE